MNRRRFLRNAGLAALSVYGCAPVLTRRGHLYVNDVHSMLNRTAVDEIVRPESVAALRRIVLDAGRRRQPLSVAGGGHAMGGQQFAADSTHIDTRGLHRVLDFDRERGLLRVEAGIQWPALVEHYLAAQPAAAESWGLIQKQTGADRFTLGGTISANAHGRVLNRKPFIADLETFDVLGPDGEIRTCSRTENSELFRMVAGGYGLFGIVTTATLRLTRRHKVERIVEVAAVDDLMAGFDRRIREGALFGDFQFSTDDQSEDFLRRGVFSCYRPVEADRAIPENQRRLSDYDWRQLLYLAHADKAEAFRRYSTYYTSTTGQLYWSDLHQMSTYLDDYHAPLDERLKARIKGSEMITEIYVPPLLLAEFLAVAREHFRRHSVPVIYGTIRLIERDDESFLPWAKQPYACVIFNLHVDHSPDGLRDSAAAFRRLIDMAMRRAGSYYLTYHRWADRGQVEACYPQFRRFIELKRAYDPEGLFQSEWWRHYRRMFAA